jgi:hypothetical protein
MNQPPSVEQLRLLLRDREAAQGRLNALGERSGERVEALQAWTKDLRVKLHELTGDWYGNPKASQYRPGAELVDAAYETPDAIPLQLLNWARKNSVVTSDATDLLRWARIVDTERHERFEPGAMTVFRAIGRGDHFLEVIRPGDWVTPDRAYAEDHLQRWLGGDGQVLEMSVDGRDVLVSPTGNAEEAIYAPLELSGPHPDAAGNGQTKPNAEVLMNDPVKLASHIRVGDTFGERMSNGGGLLGAGEVTYVDREFGLVRVKYTSGVLSGVERPERPDAECFEDIIRRRIRDAEAEIDKLAERSDEPAFAWRDDWRFRRTAMVQEWSDEFLDHVVQQRQLGGDELLGVLQAAAEDLTLSVLRGGDEQLLLRGAQALGFDSHASLSSFQEAHPMLSARLGAEYVLTSGQGRVVAASATEVVFDDESGHLKALDRSWLESPPEIGQVVAVRSFGAAEIVGDEAFDLEP